MHPELLLSWLIGTTSAATTLYGRAEALLRREWVTSVVCVLRYAEATTIVTCVVEVVSSVLLDSIDELSLHTLLIFCGFEWPGTSNALYVGLEFGLLFVLLVEHPHQITRPAHSAIEDVTLVRAFVFLFHWKALRDV